ncbi:hypothetical protein BH10BAC3_BH10BAC3_10680 [soil metagenome]
MKKSYVLELVAIFASLSLYAQPANNNYCGAITIALSPANQFDEPCVPTTTYSWVGATYKVNGEGLSCQSVGDTKNVWYKFTVPASGDYTVNTAPSSGTIPTNFLGGYQIALLSSDKCANPSAFSFYCSVYYENGTPLNYPSITVRNNVPGAVHFMAVWREGGLPDGSLKICINEIRKLAPSSEKVGVGIVSPRKNLDVNGDLHVQGNITSLGRVGIGTTNPESVLDITGRLRLKAKTVNGLESSGIWLYKQDNSAVAALLGLVDDNTVGFYGAGGAGWGLGMNTTTGNVGIGTSSPGFALNFADVVGDKISLFGNAGAHYGLGIQGDLLQIHTNEAAADIGFGFGTSASFTERMRIKGNGNVGIGTSSPGFPLNFANALGDKISLWGNAGVNYGFGVQSGLLQIHTDEATADIAFGFGNSASFTERMRIKGNGFVGIGTNNPTRPLSFPATVGEKILFYPGATGEAGIGVYGYELRLHADNPDAKVSFGTQDNAGVFTELAKAQKSGAYAFSIFGSLWANGVTYASDGRFKKNIEPLENSLEKILQLQGVSYQMKADEFPHESFADNVQMGLVAQDVEKIVPEVVTTGPNGYKAIDYAKLVPLLIEGMKAQQKEIEALKKQVKKRVGRSE